MHGMVSMGGRYGLFEFFLDAFVLENNFAISITRRFATCI